MLLESERLGVPQTPNVDMSVCNLAVCIRSWLVVLVVDHVTVEVGGPLLLDDVVALDSVIIDFH